MNVCVCCAKEIPEGTQVCYNCLQVAKEDRPVMLRLTIDDLKSEKKQLKHRLFELDYTIQELERVERRTRQ